MPSLNLLIKPASSLCNMGCRYCFYRDVADNRNTRSYGIMTYGTMHAMLKKVFAYADISVSFTFQGGEPTLAGEAWYREFHLAVEKYNEKRIPISFFLQTNGYDISDGLIDIFSRYKYLLGVSLDGDESIHNGLRPTPSGAPTYESINKTLLRLDGAGVEYNILTVITEQVASRGAEVYRSLRDRGFKFLQFIPFVSDFVEENKVDAYTLTNESYAKFLTETFREYRADLFMGRYVSVRQFDNFVRIAAGMPPECCGMGGRCYANLVVEADGGVYPCDFYVLDKWKMGDINTDSVTDLFSSDAARTFVSESLKTPKKCHTCPSFTLCKGGCRRHREDGVGAVGINRYCNAYRKFFSENAPDIIDIAKRMFKR